jgi:hypothetical protein
MTKNSLLSVLILFLSLSNASCKKAKIEVSKITYSVESKTTTINWTAYKTTEKIPVKGIFKEVSITNFTSSENSKDAINGIEFSIPVNSIDTKNLTRDAKIIKSFFGSMKNTQTITGKIHLNENGKGFVDLTMNGLTKQLPINYVQSGQLVEIDATMNLDNWETKLAIAALNLVCNEKHKGKDGISKTWDEVNIHVATYLKID